MDDTDSMTVGACLEFCSGGGFEYAGLEYTKFVSLSLSPSPHSLLSLPSRRFSRMEIASYFNQPIRMGTKRSNRKTK